MGVDDVAADGAQHAAAADGVRPPGPVRAQARLQKRNQTSFTWHLELALAPLAIADGTRPPGPVPAQPQLHRECPLGVLLVSAAARFVS